MLTLGIYTPMKLNVYCAATPEATTVEMEGQAADEPADEVEPAEETRTEQVEAGDPA